MGSRRLERARERARRVNKFGGQCPSRDKNGKAQSEHMLSGFLSITDMSGPRQDFREVPEAVILLAVSGARLRGRLNRELSPRPRSGRIEARTGLRMMPTFPRSPLSFRTAGFPQYGWKAGFQAVPSRLISDLSLLPACAVR